MVAAFFVANAFGVAVVTGEAAVGEELVGALTAIAQQDDRGRRVWRVSAKPEGIDGARRPRKVVGGTEHLDRACFAVVADGDGEVSLLVVGQGIANRGDGL